MLAEISVSINTKNKLFRFFFLYGESQKNVNFTDHHLLTILVRNVIETIFGL